ncbi:MAG: glycosyltransferase family 87 protein [Acidobacteriota bacterium]
MSKRKVEGLYLFAAGAVLFLILGCLWRSDQLFRMCDFKAVSYAAQALAHHQNPYSEHVLQGIYYSAPENYAMRSTPPQYLRSVTLCVNLPTTVMFFVPMALLPWKVATVVWPALLGVSLILAGWLMWTVASDWSPLVAGVLLFLFFSGSQSQVETGNLAGIAISFCICGAYCLIKQKYVPIGVVCLGLALVCKPQDAGFVWLYFFLAGGEHRRRAWQILALSAAFFLPAALWMYHVSPHWLQELRANLLSTSAPGQVNSPLAMVEPACHGAMIVSLQTVVGIFTARPILYNGIVYILCAPFILLWGAAVLRGRPSQERDWMGLAAIVPISMLVCYHRQHDTRLLILAIPACAILISRPRGAARLAVIASAFTALVSSNPLLELFGAATFALRHAAQGLRGELLTAILARPVPLAMLIQGACLCLLFAQSSMGAEARFGWRDRVRLMVREDAIAPQNCTPTLECPADQEA